MTNPTTNFLSSILEDNGFSVRCANDGTTGEKLIGRPAVRHPARSDDAGADWRNVRQVARRRSHQACS